LTVAGVVLTDPALDDLRRAGPVAAALLLGRLRALEVEPDGGAPLVDERTGYRLLDALDGAARIVFSTGSTAGVGGDVTVHALWVDGSRTDGEAYAEALERIRAADPSEQVALARVVQRLGRLTGVRPVPRDRLRAPVPDWLADALVARGGQDRLAVAAMDATTAFNEWNRFLETEHPTTAAKR
jgi:mRNA interferase RelE/StbE